MTEGYYKLEDRNITVLGAGESGMAAARWLVSKGARVTVSDSRPAETWDRGFTDWCSKNGVIIEAGKHGRESCTGCDIIVVSPGIPASSKPIMMATEAGCTVVNDLVLAASFFKGKIIAITGTNGKTTTTMLTAHLLENAGFDAIAAGNISPPLFEVMDHDVAVLEVSSFQLELLEKTWNLPFRKPKISVAVWLNLAPDHLDRHGDIDSYGECKAHLLDLQSEEDWAVLNASDPGISPWLSRGRGRRFYFGPRRQRGAPGTWYSADTNTMWTDCTGSMPEPESYDLSSWRLSGTHNLENLAAAISAARLAGARKELIQQALETFSPPSHRYQTVLDHEGITYIDDSKATNAAATIRALEYAGAPVALIAGGLGKDEDYTPLAAVLKRLWDRGMLRTVVLMGEHGNEIAEAVQQAAGSAIPLEFAGKGKNGESVMKRAVELCLKYTRPGDAVLLSPACASFDMFNSYSHRGDTFQKAVKAVACS